MADFQDLSLGRWVRPGVMLERGRKMAVLVESWLVASHIGQQ